MTIARCYIMKAAEGRAEDLAAALKDAAELVRRVPGSQGVEILRDLDDRRRLVFIEKWDSVEAHKAAPQHLPKGALANVMAAVDGPPEGSYLDYLAVV